jgi:DNA replication protein DnaC
MRCWTASAGATTCCWTTSAGAAHGVDRETLYLVVNARYEACRVTSVVTNLDLDALAAHAGAAIVDRLAETNPAYWCEWESYRRRRRAGA